MAVEIKINVRGLVEFIFRAGDIDNRRTGAKEKSAMEAGSRIHRKIQKQMGGSYESEVTLRHTIETELYSLIIEGRADGIFSESYESFKEKVEERDYLPQFNDMLAGRFPGGNRFLSAFKEENDEEDDLTEFDLSEEIDFSMVGSDQKLPASIMVIDEIKGIYRDPLRMEEPVPVHKAQAMCYAYFYAIKYDKSFMGVQMTYANLETEDIKRFYDIFTREELSSWFLLVLKEYDKWASLEALKRERLLDSIKPLAFPFPYRPGQKKLAASVYRTIEQKKELFIQAPTGIGKTMSALFPAIKAMGEGLAEKVFYLTAKTITRTVAEEAFLVLREKGLCMTSVTITAKEKICPMTECVCNPDACPYAQGHYDRINEALYDILTSEVCFDRETILGFAAKHQVCPFEYSLDLTLFSEGIICDYNYVYDPNVYLRRFFGDTAKSGKYIFLVDEAHNLPDRAREMFSARLVKEDVLTAEKLFKEISGNTKGDSPEAIKAAGKVLKELKALNKKLLAYKKEFDQPEDTAQVLYDIELLALQALSLQDAFSVFLEETRVHADDELLNFYFDLRHFNAMYETMDDHYLIYASSERGRFMITLLCANPANCVHTAGERAISTIFFSATMLPMGFYKELLTTDDKAYAIYVPSPFDQKKRLLLTASDVSSRYNQRGPQMYKRILDYIVTVTEKKCGNYMVFFPSYQYMEEVAAVYYERYNEETVPFSLLLQESGMTEVMRDEFLSAFRQERKETMVGFCVIGGIFSEGIDLTGESLIGALIVGTGLSQVNAQDDLLRSYFDEKGKKGYDYAYRYPGINKVFQAAGRVIRTTEDEGVVVLLDNRMLDASHVRLFPMDWDNYEACSLYQAGKAVEDFWRRREKEKKT